MSETVDSVTGVRVVSLDFRLDTLYLRTRSHPSSLLLTLTGRSSRSWEGAKEVRARPW